MAQAARPRTEGEEAKGSRKGCGRTRDSGNLETHNNERDNGDGKKGVVHTGSMRGSMRRVARTDVTDEAGGRLQVHGGEGECDVKRTLQ